MHSSFPPLRRRRSCRSSTAATIAALDMPAVQQRLKQIGGDVIAPERRSPEYLAQFLAAEIKRWEAPIKASGIQLE